MALKEISTDRAGDLNSQSRFLREAEITGRLEHPGIVPVYALGRHADGRPYYAMRFIRGQSLREAIMRLHGAEGPARNCRLGLGAAPRCCGVSSTPATQWPTHIARVSCTAI